MRIEINITVMCNRIRNVQHLLDIALAMNVARINSEYNPNVAPTEMTPAILAGIEAKPKAQLARFGINLKSADGKKRPPLLNSRTDTLRRGSFKSILNKRRCIIPAEGFYEWREENGKKQPYFFYRKDGKPILFAGIWDFSDVKGDEVASFAILTDEPNELVAPYHDRMPVVLDDHEPWLSEGENPLDRLNPLGPEFFAVRPVNMAVNRVAEKDIAKIEAPADGLLNL